jgi:hypothetical protein
MPHILSIVFHTFQEIGSFVFGTSQVDEGRKVEAIRIAYRATLWPRV